MYAVTGATGNTGRAAVRALVARGERVRAIVHDPDKGKALSGPGIEVVPADLHNPAELVAALAGVQGAYLLRPRATRAGGATTAQSFREAIEQSDVERFVVLSSIGAQHATGTGVVGGLHDLEQELAHASKTVTFLRAASFLENWIGFMGAARAGGVLPSLLPADFAFAQVAAADVGAVVATLLIDGSDGRRLVGLDGPESWSAADVARALGGRLGKTIPVFAIPPEAQQGQLEGAGVPAPYAVEVVELYAGILNRTVSRPLGEPTLQGPTTLEQWVADHA